MLYIFDIGGVCTNNASDNYSRICRITGLTASEFDAVCKKGLNIWEALADGIIDAREFWEEFNKRSGLNIKCDWWHMLFHPARNEETYNIIKHLKAAGNRVVAGTNTIESHYLNHIERGDYQIFDQTYASIFMGVSKPDPEFWKIILTAEDVRAEECIFIDDKAENIQAAQKLGIKSIQFKDAISLKKELGL